MDVCASGRAVALSGARRDWNAEWAHKTGCPSFHKRAPPFHSCIPQRTQPKPCYQELEVIDFIKATHPKESFINFKFPSSPSILPATRFRRKEENSSACSRFWGKISRESVEFLIASWVRNPVRSISASSPLEFIAARLPATRKKKANFHICALQAPRNSLTATF